MSIVYRVVGCSDCESVKIVEGQVETTTCNRCQTQIDMNTVRVLFQSDDYEEAKEARSLSLARRQGFDYLADEMVEQEVLDERVTEDVDDSVERRRGREVSDAAESQMTRGGGDRGGVPPGDDGDIPEPRDGGPAESGPTEPGGSRARGGPDAGPTDSGGRDGRPEAGPERDLGVPRASDDVEPGGVAEDDVMEAAGVDTDEVEEAGEVTSPSSEADRSPETRIVKDAIEFLDDPTDEDVQAFAEDRGVDRERTERIVDGLCMEGEAMRTKDGEIRLV